MIIEKVFRLRAIVECGHCHQVTAFVVEIKAAEKDGPTRALFRVYGKTQAIKTLESIREIIVDPINESRYKNFHDLIMGGSLPENEPPDERINEIDFRHNFYVNAHSLFPKLEELQDNQVIN